jgi:hypothetical protein
MKRTLSEFFISHISLSVLAFLSVAAIALIIVACSSTSTSTSTGTGTGSGPAMVNVRISDPATCQSPSGPFSHVYVTITDVKAHVNATAGDSDMGWVDLTPNLSNGPMQVDLLGQANNQCFLATLGDAQQLQPGSYQQIRLILASNSATVANNACGSSANCVILASDSSVHTLQLSSESKTGIKIPSGQIASGGFTVAAGQTRDLDIDFITCQSILRQGNGQYRLKPVLHAGEVSTTSTSINGKVLDGVTGNPVDGKVVAAVEQKDAIGIDRVQRATLAGVDGSFVFCPLPAGTYDVVIVGTRSDGAIYEPSIVTGVSVGSTTGNVNLFALTSATMSSSTLNGIVTSQNSSNMGTVADVELSVLETLGSVTYTIPLSPTSTQSSATLSLETAAPGGGLTCPNNTDCADYTLAVSSGAANVGAWSASGTILTANVTLATYKMEGQASVPSSGGLADCTPSERATNASSLSAGGSTVAVDPLAFTACQ